MDSTVHNMAFSSPPPLQSTHAACSRLNAFACCPRTSDRLSSLRSAPAACARDSAFQPVPTPTSTPLPTSSPPPPPPSPPTSSDDLQPFLRSLRARLFHLSQHLHPTASDELHVLNASFTTALQRHSNAPPPSPPPNASAAVLLTHLQMQTAHTLYSLSSSTKSRQHVGVISVRGAAHRRNEAWAGLPWRILRGQKWFVSASVAPRIRYPKDLRLLRRDAMAMSTVGKTLPDARWISDVVGYDGMRGAMRAWTRMQRGNGWRQGFERRFADARVAAGVMAYVRMRRAKLKDRRLREMVRVREIGMCVAEIGNVSMGAVIEGVVAERKERDFWNWGTEEGVLLVCVTQNFCRSGREWEVMARKVGQGVNETEWIGAQVAMACAGNWALWADVVLYASFGGMTVVRVWRNDEFLQSVGEVVRRFVNEFGIGGSAPGAGFHQETAVSKLRRVVSDGCSATTEAVEHVATDLVESWVDEARQRMNEFEKRRTERAFV